jgi:hypothetical protein
LYGNGNFNTGAVDKKSRRQDRIERSTRMMTGKSVVLKPGERDREKGKQTDGKKAPKRKPKARHSGIFSTN